MDGRRACAARPPVLIEIFPQSSAESWSSVSRDGPRIRGSGYCLSSGLHASRMPIFERYCRRQRKWSVGGASVRAAFENQQSLPRTSSSRDDCKSGVPFGEPQLKVQRLHFVSAFIAFHASSLLSPWYSRNVGLRIGDVRPMRAQGRLESTVAAGDQIGEISKKGVDRVARMKLWR